MQTTYLEKLEGKMGQCWHDILSRPLAQEIKKILASGDKKLYALWLCQVAHLTKHTSAHQALVGTRLDEISHVYMKFCFEHALEEVGHELMAIHDLKKIGSSIETIQDLPPPLNATEQLTAYLYYISERGHPLARLGFSYWAEKCYPFIQSMTVDAQNSMGLADSQMTFFVSHSRIDEKHAEDVERVIQLVCKSEQDLQAVEDGMNTSLQLAMQIFEEIYQLSNSLEQNPKYADFLRFLDVKQ